jgi:hypothetical protein
LLWKYFIALGKLHIIAGAPGDGKTGSEEANI